MKLHRNGTRRGFSLVELLAVVLILAVLAAVAIPLYINTRRSSAARACKANLAAIAAASSAYALRNGQYPQAPMNPYEPATPTSATSGLIGAPEGLSQAVTCPLDGQAYTFAGGGAGAALTITCPNAVPHATVVPNVPAAANNYQRVMPAPTAETIP